MTSSPRPANAGPSTAPSAQPLTPPADAPATQNGSSQANPSSSANPAPTSTPAPAISQPTQVPATSLQDTGKSRRPRDARLIHMLLASLGVTAYQERVPLQLLDFAYRYTAGTLQDAVYLATEGYPGERETGGGRSHYSHQDLNSVSLGALRMSIASRLHYQFQPGLPKEFLMDLAAERNRMMLPGVSRGVDGGTAFNTATPGAIMGGMRLPPERFCQTGVSWSLKEEWESEEEEEMEFENNPLTQQSSGTLEKENGDEADDDEGDGRMEDVFGDDGLKEEEQDEDKTMVDA